MNKRTLAVLVILTLTLSLLAGCGKNELTVNTVAGEINASDYYNWQKYEKDVIDSIKLSKEKQDEIDNIILPLENGTAKDSEIESIIEEYKSIENYKEYLEDTAKYIQAREDATKDIEVTDEDRKEFIEKYEDTFASRNAIVFQFDNNDKAIEFINSNVGKSQSDVLKYIASKAELSEVTWEDINSNSEKSGIELLHNADSNKYNYCDGSTLSTVFDSMQDGQMSDAFVYGNKSTVLWRISNNVIEKDDALIDNYMLKIKKEEAYKKYIIDNK